MDWSFLRKKIPCICLALLLLCIPAFLIYYFYHYLNPFYANGNVADISRGWSYHTDSDSTPRPLDKLQKAFDVAPGEAMYLERTLQEDIKDASVMVKFFHQRGAVYLDDAPLMLPEAVEGNQSPGIGLWFVQLPEDYAGRTLRIVIESPYAAYAGMPQPVTLGDTGALHAKIFSEAFPHLFMLFVCCFTGLFLIGLSTISITRGKGRWGTFFFGIFSILLGILIISRDDLSLLVFSPEQSRFMDVGIHIVYLIPLMLYMNCFFTRFRKLSTGIISLYGLFAVVLYYLELSGSVDWVFLLMPINWTLAATFIPIIALIVYEYIRKNPLFRFLSYSIAAVVLTAVGTIFDYYHSPRLMYALYLLAVFFFLASAWVYHLKKLWRDRTKAHNDLHVLEINNKLMRKNYQEISTHIEQMQIIRHEVDHHVAALQILCGQGDIDRINAYLTSLSDDIKQVAVRYSNNQLVNAILSNSIAQAQQAGIQVKYRVDVPVSLPISDADLSSLLMNMLDNAIHANRNLPPDVDRWMDIQLRLKGEFLVISCGNSCHMPAPTDDRPATGNADPDRHGYGIPIMRSIVERYGSILDISYDQNSFSLKTVLYVGKLD